MRTFSQTLLLLSTVANIRGLKSIAAALCFGITLCLTGIANAQTDTYSWTGTIVSVEVDDGTGTYTGTQVGDIFSGTFTYDPDSGNIIQLFTSDGDSIIEPGDVWVEYFPGSASATLTDGTTELPWPGAALSITTDYPINDPDDQEFDTLTFNARMPVLTPPSGNQAIKGVIQDTMYIYNPLSDFDTIKFTAYIIDRALNESNQIETPPIVRIQ